MFCATFSVFILVACSDNEINVKQAEGEITSLWNLKFSRPNDLTLQHESKERIRYCIQKELGTRHPRCVTFSKIKLVRLDDSHTKMQVDKYSIFRFEKRAYTQGSIGTEHKINGYLTYKDEEFNNVRLDISADAFGDAGHDDASWVLPIVKSIHR